MSTQFENNRGRFMRAIDSSVVVLTAYSQQQRMNDSAFKFEQEANFWYLTGINVPNWRLILNTKTGESWLVAPDVDAVHEVFDGSLSVSEAARVSGVSAVLSQDGATMLLKDLAKKHKVVYTLGKDPYEKHYDFALNPAQKLLTRSLKTVFSDVKDCRRDLAKLRAIKAPEEIVAIKRAIALTIKGFERVKRQLPKLHYEYEIEAEFTHEFRSKGALGHAYDPIIASGKNACTLHYNDNQQELTTNQLVLLDVGARVDGYAADITRTYSVGAPTDRQQQVHRAVEQAHYKIIELLKPGCSVAKYQQAVDEIMKDSLMSLGLLKPKDDTKQYRNYFPHAISHGLGIDVHDSLGGPTEFMPGMVLTVEPGIYIKEEGIGVRIEDDILITESGHENLSTALSTSL